MDFLQLLSLTSAGIWLVSIAGFVALVALVSRRNHDGGIHWFTKAVVAINVGLAFWALLRAFSG